MSKEVRGAAVAEAQAAATAALEAAAAGGGPSYTPLQISMALKVTTGIGPFRSSSTAEAFTTGCHGGSSPTRSYLLWLNHLPDVKY